jgi:hypothetical protein
VSRRRRTDLLVLLGYAAVSFAYFGWRLLPHPGRLIAGFGGDAEISIWSFAWWPHALGTFTNPFVSHAIYAPTGVNLTWSASVPGLALVFSPLTVLAGPVASYNIAAVLAPALSAWTAYLLCRHLTGSLWASLVGGYLFGFSAAILRQQLYGHLNLTAIFLVPLVALVVVRFVQGGLDGRGLARRLGVLLAAQLWLSTEFALTLTVMLALALALAAALVPASRARLRASLLPIVVGYGLGALFAAPLVVYILLGIHGSSFADLTNAGADLAGFVVPTKAIGLGGSWFGGIHVGASGASAYLGLPTLAIVGWLVVVRRRDPWVRFLAAMLAVSVLIALGTALYVGGHRVVALPWAVAAHVPLLYDALPFRFVAFAALAAGVMVAVWTATTRGLLYARPYLLPSLAVLALVPAVWRTTYPTFEPVDPHRPAFFADGLYRSCIPRGETVALFPFGGHSLLLQAESGFWFRLAANGLTPQPKHAPPRTAFDADPIVYELTWADTGRPTMSRLLEFAAVQHVDRVVSTGGYPSPAQLRSFGPTQRLGGATIAPACGRPSLATRDLTPYLEKYRSELAGHRANVGYCHNTYFYELPEGLVPAGALAGATRARFVSGQGLTCAPVPKGYVRRGFASPDLGVPANTYPYYASR